VLPGPVPVRGPSGLLAEDALVAVANAVGAARGRGWFPLLLGSVASVESSLRELASALADYENLWH
jgi:hypothetical protein